MTPYHIVIVVNNVRDTFLQFSVYKMKINTYVHDCGLVWELYTCNTQFEAGIGLVYLARLFFFFFGFFFRLTTFTYSTIHVYRV